MELSRLNDVTEPEAREALRRCCGSVNWVNKMMALRPFSSAPDLFEKAEKCADSLDRADWLEAFSKHPKIGDLDLLRRKFQSATQWESGEQSGVAAAGDKTLQELADGNRDYENKFGYIFIVCASGKSADEMLDLLKSRINNDAETEIKIASGEQRKITELRLEKLCR